MTSLSPYSLTILSIVLHISLYSKEKKKKNESNTIFDWLNVRVTQSEAVLLTLRIFENRKKRENDGYFGDQTMISK